MLKRLLERIKKGGWKRHTGALFIALYAASKLFGVELPAEVERWLPIVGEALWGVGWLDKFRRITMRVD